MTEPPFALSVFAEDVVIDGPAGRATALSPASSAAQPRPGAEALFYVGDRSALPKLTNVVGLWGEDNVLIEWLAAQGIAVRPFTSEPQTARELILAGVRPPAPDGAAVFRDLARHLARGSTAIFLASEIFAQGKASGHWLPLVKKGALTARSGPGWSHRRKRSPPPITPRSIIRPA